MQHIRKVALIIITTLLTATCGGGESSSSSGSGIGGTGITLVRGNVASVDNQSVAVIGIDSTPNLTEYVTNWVIPVSFAQVAGVNSLTVSGGGQSTKVNSNGQFVLPNVSPSMNFILTFTVDGRQNIDLGLGQVNKGAVVTVKNVAIDTRSGSAKPDDIDKEEPEDDDISNDRDDQISNDADDQSSTDDDVSTDDPDSDDTDDDSSDDTEEEDDHQSSDKN